jgi:hypothetical protein
VKLLALLLAAAVTAAAIPAEVPQNTILDVRLTTAISSRTSKVNDSVGAVLIAPVMTGGQVAIEPGAILRGRVASVSPLDRDRRAYIRLEFSEIQFRDGRVVPIETTLARVDNARESVDTSGRVIGILPSETIAAHMDRGLEGLAERNAELAGVLAFLKSVLIREVDADIGYPAGVELALRVEKPLTVSTLPGLESGDTVPVPLAPELSDLVQNQPIRTVAERPALPSDLTNLMFAGSRQDLEKAFGEAGWTPAARINSDSVFETARAIIESRGYKEAPVSTLLLDGRHPDLVFQKGNNTFAMRHHVRIWRRDGSYRGRSIWVGAATHDVGIGFASDERTFFHTIDPQIDKERTKIVHDLTFTGLVSLSALAERPHVPRETTNATGDRMITDGRMAVLLFK